MTVVAIRGNQNLAWGGGHVEPATYKEIKSLFDEYIDLYSSRNDLLTDHFSSDFSGFAGGADNLVKDREEWIAVTRQDFAQVKGALRIEVKDLAIQSLAEDVAVATSFFSIKLPIEDDYFSRKTARLVLVFHKQAGEWKIAHSSISIPYGLVGKGEIYPLKGVQKRNRLLEQVISERTKELSDANETLTESEHRFREMLETINLLAVTLDPDGRVTFCNNYLLTLTGWRREDVIGADWFDKFLPEENSELKSLYLDSLAASALPAHQQNPIRTRSGETRLVHWNNTILRDGTGRIVGTASIGEDVTERKQTEERAARLAAIVQSSEDAIIGTTMDGTITSWNTGAEKTYGYTEAEVLGKNIAMLVPPGRGDEVPEILRRIRRGDHIEHFDTLHLRKDSTDVFMSLTISPIRDSVGKVVAASIIGRDVTERKLAEEVLRRNEEQFRVIAENVADMIAVFDLDGRRRYSSPAYKGILGDPELLNGTNGFQGVHTDDAVRVSQAFRETVTTGISRRIEFRVMAKDGSTRNIDSKISVIREIDGAFSRAIAVSRDVTEEKKLAAQFLRSQRMESIGTLAGGIAHDLNNILAPIMMAIELLRSKVRDMGGQKLLTTIETSAKRGADIVKQVLAFGRGVTGDRVLVQLKHVITDVVKIVSGTFPKSITVEEALGRDLWAVQADPTQMHQVFLNVLVNARDAMPGGGNSDDFCRKRDAGRKPGTQASGSKTGKLSVHSTFRHRNRDSRKYPEGDFRTLLYDEGGGTGNGTRAFNHTCHRQESWRIHRPGE
jgi:PAS domain S-box-containing protein